MGIGIEIHTTHHGNGIIDTCCHYLDGMLHREDGPAYVVHREDGTVRCDVWYCHDKRHRENGPAVEWFLENGTTELCHWYHHGKKHREDGPATEGYGEDGIVICAAVYYLEDEWLSQEEYRRRAALRKLVAATTGKSEVSL